jgi:hypothetical protein
MRMKRSGRASLVIVILVALVAAVVVLFLMAGDSPSGVAGRFLTALAKGDTKTLADLSYMEGKTTDQIKDEWDKTKGVTKYWQFQWKIQDSKDQDADNSTVVLGWVKNSASISAYEEKYELPLVKRDGKWKIDVRGISREMYPALPR